MVVGLFDSFEDAVKAIQESILLGKIIHCWCQALVTVHDSNVETLGYPDAYRRFRHDGTVYIPDMCSEEMVARSCCTRGVRERWAQNECSSTAQI